MKWKRKRFESKFELSSQTVAHLCCVHGHCKCCFLSSAQPFILMKMSHTHLKTQYSRFVGRFFLISVPLRHMHSMPAWQEKNDMILKMPARSNGNLYAENLPKGFRFSCYFCFIWCSSYTTPSGVDRNWIVAVVMCYVLHLFLMKHFIMPIQLDGI